MRVRYSLLRRLRLKSRVLPIKILTGFSLLTLLVSGAVVGQNILGDTPTIHAGTTVSGLQDFKTSSYRLYQNADSLTPGAPLSDVNTPATLSTAGQSFRLRAGLKSEMKWKQTASAYENMCGIAEDGKVYCWGRNYDGALGNSSVPEVGSTVPVAVDWSGALVGKTAKYLVAGGYNFCVIASDDQVYCWGGNWQSALGNGQASDQLGYSPSPTAVDASGVLSGKTVRAIDMNESAVCVVASDSKAYCWGYKNNLGNNITVDSPSPTAVDTSGVLSGKNLIDVAASAYHFCALSDDGYVYCWGGSSSIRAIMGDGVSNYSKLPVAVKSDGALANKKVVDITAAYYGSICALTDDNGLYCWGSNYGGQLGNGTTTDSNVPGPVDMSGVLDGKTFTRFAENDYGDTVCVFDVNNKLYCWGIGQSGQMGNGQSTYAQTTPIEAMNSGTIAGGDVLEASPGYDFGCAVDSEGQGHCAGANWDGSLGDGGVVADKSLNTVQIVSTGAPIEPSIERFILQFAQRTVTTCELQNSGFSTVSNNSAIAFNDNSSLNSGQAIAVDANDPIVSPLVKHQSYVEGGSFTNNSIIDPATYGLWDFSLRDNGAIPGTDYCIRIAYEDGTPLEKVLNVAQVTIAPEQSYAPTVNSVEWVDGRPVISGTFDFDNSTGLRVTVAGTVYVLGVNSALTSDGDNWTLNLTGQSVRFEPSTYVVLVEAATSDGVLSAQLLSSFEENSANNLASTGVSVRVVLSAAVVLAVFGAMTLRLKRAL